MGSKAVGIDPVSSSDRPTRQNRAMHEPLPATAVEGADALAARTGVGQHALALVVASGWAGSVESLGQTVSELAAADLPGFARATVEGHAGLVRSIAVDGHPV